MANLDLRYRKTAAGGDELLSRQLGLSREQRNLLIVADGRHALSVYCQAVGCDPAKLSALADHLIGLRLIEALGASRAPQPTAAPDSSAAPAMAPSVKPAEAETPSVAVTADTPEVLRQRLSELAAAIFGAQAATPVIARLEKAQASVAELVAAVEGAAKLAKLTIDEAKAQSFLSEARRLLGL
jgi:hypothetical protein